MQTQSATAVALLVTLQLLILRIGQHAVPSLYFTTSSLFDRRNDVSGAAVLFRLGVPVTAGIAAALLAPANEALVAFAAGAICWFLIIWPIIWNPRIVGHSLRPAFIAVLGAFWLAFAVLPLAGAGIANVALDAFAGEAPDWQTQYVWAIATAVPIGLLVRGANRLARTKLSFADDPVDEHSDPADSTDLDEEETTSDPWSDISGSPFVWVFAGIALGVVSTRLLRLSKGRSK